MTENTREFSLPHYEDLTKEQDQLIKWKRKGKLVIVGGPGTGKTTIALILAQKMKNENNSSKGLLLMLNRALANMSKQLTIIDVDTYHKWFWVEFQNLYNERPKEVKKYIYDWNAIENIYLNTNNRKFDENNQLIKSKELIMIDEGQDLPYGFYKFIESHYENIFVTADENQTGHSTIEEIILALKYDFKDIKELTYNFRNTKQIANFANTFFTAQFGSYPIAGKRAGELPLLYQYSNVLDNRDKMISHIIQRHRMYPRRLIGFLTTRSEIRDYYYEKIRNYQGVVVYNDGGEIIHFKGGIVVINHQGAKGLEFDELFIADINEHRFNSDQQNTIRKELYVETTRPKERLFILYNKDNPNQNILNLLTEDESILRRV